MRNFTAEHVWYFKTEYVLMLVAFEIRVLFRKLDQLQNFDNARISFYHRFSFVLSFNLQAFLKEKESFYEIPALSVWTRVQNQYMIALSNKLIDQFPHCTFIYLIYNFWLPFLINKILIIRFLKSLSVERDNFIISGFVFARSYIFVQTRIMFTQT